MIPFIKTGNSISFFYNGKQYSFAKDAPNFQQVVDAVMANDTDRLEQVADIRKMVLLASNGNVRIYEDKVYVEETEVPIYLAKRIIEHVREGCSVDGLCMFAQRLLRNPTPDVREDLYRWIENGNMPVTSDGGFIAYKKVRSDYHSIYAPDDMRYIHIIGSTLYQDRDECDSDRTSTCSTGLHFCSFDYLRNFGSSDSDNKVVTLLIYPEDVVAIPVDYNLTKGRACKYTVIGEVEDYSEDVLRGTYVYDPYEYRDEDGDDWGDEDYYEDEDEGEDESLDWNLGDISETISEKPLSSLESKICDLYNSGYSASEVSRILQITEDNVNLILKNV